jgi:hypothetical protein
MGYGDISNSSSGPQLSLTLFSITVVSIYFYPGFSRLLEMIELEHSMITYLFFPTYHTFHSLSKTIIFSENN